MTPLEEEHKAKTEALKARGDTVILALAFARQELLQIQQRSGIAADALKTMLDSVSDVDLTSGLTATKDESVLFALKKLPQNQGKTEEQIRKEFNL